jgi:hypothetical protein
MTNLNVGVLGGGSWGTTVASLVTRNAPVMLWALPVELPPVFMVHPVPLVTKPSVNVTPFTVWLAWSFPKLCAAV